MEGGAFLSRDIQSEFKRFVMIELHTDGRSDEYRASSELNRELQRKRFKTISLPYYVLMDPSGKTIYWEGGGRIPPDEFLAKLKSVPQVK